MNKRKIFYRIMSILLIVITLLTSQSESILAATSKNPKNQSGKRLSDGKKPKDQPIGKELKTKKPSKIPYGILKNENKLEKWKNKKELIEERTGNSKTYLNDDGTKTTLMFFEPIHVKAGKDASKNEKYGKNNLKQSAYLEINNDLMPIETKSNGKSGYKNTFGLYDIYFPSSTKESIRLNKDGHTMSLLPNDLKWEDMEIEENQVFVPSQTDGITYVYSVNNTGLKEDIVLNYQTDKKNFTYELMVDSKYKVYAQNNMLYVQGKNSKTVYYTLSAPYMMDREGNVSHNISLEVEQNGGKYLVTVTPDHDWLKEETRAYPVVIDPTVKIQYDGEFRDTYVEEGQPDVTQFDREELYVGYDDGIASRNGEKGKELKTKTFIKLELPSTLNTGSKIEKATLNMHVYTNWSREQRSVEVREVLSAFPIPLKNDPNYTDCIRWNDLKDIRFGDRLDTEIIDGAGNYTWNITSFITGILKGETLHGLVVQMENDMSQAEVFNSAQTTDSQHRPYVEITYNSMPDPDPASDKFELVLERDDKFEPGTAYAKSKLVWNAESSENGESGGLEGSTEKFNKATIKYTLMPDNISKTIVEENFTELEWKTDKFDLEKDKAYWFKADIKVEQWKPAEASAENAPSGGSTGSQAGAYEEVYSETLKTKKFVVAEAQPGDTLKRLAKYYVKDPAKTTNIYKMNKLEEEKLSVGQHLFIMTGKEEPYNYDQPSTITSSIMTKDAVAGSVSDQTEKVGRYINPTTGSFNYYNTDFSYSVYSNYLDFTRSYASKLENRKSALGDGWDYNFNKYLMFYKDGKIGYNVGDGSRIYFTKSSGKYTTTAPTYDQLVVKEDQYEIITADKTTYIFNEVGLLTEIADKNNNKTIVEYDENDWQNKITDALDRTITIRYYDDETEHTGNIKEVKLPDNTTLTFEYEQETNHLTGFHDREANVTTYSYNEDGKLEQLIEPEENTLITNRYLEDGKVSVQKDGENHTVELDYNSGSTTVVDGRNQEYIYHYDSKKRVTKKTYPETIDSKTNATVNYYEAFQYNTKGNIIKYTDTMGRVHEYTYNSLGYITSYTRPEDQKVYQYDYEEDYLVSQLIDFEGNKTSMVYDENDNLDRVIQYNTINGAQKQIITDYNYASNGLLEKIVDPSGITTQIDYSNYPGKVKTTFAGIPYTETFDKLGRTLTSTDGNNNTTKTTYDKNGNVLAVIYPSDGEMNRNVTYTYDKNSNIESVTSSREVPDIGGFATTYYTYDNNNRLEQVTDPYNGVVINSYDGNGNVATISDQEQNVTTYQYDSNNRLKEIYQPGQTKPAFVYEYDALGNTIKVTEADGDYTEYEIDYKVEQVSKVINPENYTVSYTYDDMGNLLRETEPDTTIRYEYDDLYQPTKIMESGEPTTSVIYDESGRITKIQDEKGIIYNYHYDSVTGQLVEVVEEVTEAAPQLITQEVNDNLTGSLLSASSSVGYVPTVFELNFWNKDQELNNQSGIMTNTSMVSGLAYSNDNINNYTYSNTFTTQYTYDSNGNVKTIKDKQGNITTYNYNELNQVSNIVDPMNKATQFFYDEDGNLNKSIDGEGNVTITQYDAMNRLYKVTVPEENTTETYLYDSRGNIDNFVDPMGNVTSYEYDARGRLQKLIDANLQAIEYSYNEDDTLKKILYPNGDIQEYAYDGLNRPNWFKDRNSITYNIDYTPSGQTDYISDSVGNHADYRYDAYGRLTEVEDTIGRVTSYTYDNFSRLLSETGSDGNTTTYEYDAYDRIRKIKDPEQKVTHLTYNPMDNIIQIVNPGQRIYTYDYDPSGNLTKVTDPLGNATEYNYNNNNAVSEIINARGFSKKYEYNGLNQVEKATDERNYTTSYDYYPGGLLKSVSDPLNNTTSYTYNPVNKVDTIQNALYETTTFNYDFFGNTTITKDNRGVTTTNVYDASNQIVFTYDTENNFTQNEYYPNGDLRKTTDQEGRITEYFYDALHRVTKTIEPNGLVKNYVYDEVTGDLIKVYDNAGQETTYTYDKIHRILSETDIQELVTTYTYDEFGNLKTKTTPDGNTTSYTYDELDRITSIIDPENNLTELAYDPVGNLDYIVRSTNLKYDYTYDPANNIEKILDPLGKETIYTYDGNNNIDTMLDPSGNLFTYQYDALNRLTTIKDLAGSGSQYDYDASGNIIGITDGNGNVTKYQYNNLNLLESVEDAEGNITRYTYYKDGNLKSMTDARGNTSSYTYDASGNMSTFTNPKGEVIQYNYNLLDQIDEEIKADGNTIDYIYDQYNRLESIFYPDQASVKYTYDDLNRKIAMEDANGLTEYAYDDMSRLTWVSDPNSEQVSYEYDDKGRKTTVIYPDGKYVEYQYDEYDRIIGVNDREGRITRYTYDEAGRKKTTTLPNGITTTYEYDEGNKIIGITSVKKDGSIVLKFAYEYDSAGNRTLEEIWQKEKHYRREYTYYKNNTVKSMVESGDNNVTYSYVYDAAGNISEKHVTETKDGQTTTKVYRYTYDIANRMLSVAEEGGDVRTYRYDANGNRIARVLNSKDNGTDSVDKVTDSEDNTTISEVNADKGYKETADYYYYDYEDRLVEIVLHNGKVFTYGYDGEGNRLWRTYSQYPLVKPPVDEGERVDDPPTFPGYNKDNTEEDTAGNKDKSNNGNGNQNKEKDKSNNRDKEKNGNNGKGNGNTVSTNSNVTPETLSATANQSAINLEFINEIEKLESKEVNELITLLDIQDDKELITAVDSYLLSTTNMTYVNLKGNNGNGNGNGNSGNSSNNGSSQTDDGTSENTTGSSSSGNGNNGNGNGNGNSSGNQENNGNGNGNGNSSGNQDNNGIGNGNNNGNGNTNEKGNGNKGNDKSDAWKENGDKEDKEKSNGKTKEHSNNGHDKNLNENGKGHAYGKNKDKSNNGKHKGWNNNGNDNNNPNKPDKPNNPDIPNNGDDYDLTNPEIFEVTNYINDINQEFTQVLMTTDIDRNYRGVYTYGNGERISVEDLGHVEGVPNNPLYYLSDALGSTVAITNMNAGIIDNNRFAPYGEPLSPVAKNSRLTNSPWGYTGESHDIEAGLVYLRARYYEPGMGRFIQQDSYLGDIKNPLSLNLYIYCEGNPIIYSDPSGHAKKKYLPDYFFDGKYQYVYCTVGSSGNNSYLVEKILYELKYYRGKVDSIYEINTQNAVKKFQKDNYLKVNGVVEQRTMAFLKAAQTVHRAERGLTKKELNDYKNSVFHSAKNVPYKFPSDGSEFFKSLNDLNNVYKNLFKTTGEIVVNFIPGLDIIYDGVNLTYNIVKYKGTTEEDINIVAGFISMIPLVGDIPGLKYVDEGAAASKYVDDVVEGASKTVYSNIDDGLNFSNKALTHMDEAGRSVPVQTLQDAIKNGKALPDPRGSSATMYYTTMTKNGKMYNLEVLYDSATNTVYHFEYARKAMGNLPAITK